MAPQEFEYDIAFSFLGQDEATATAINDLLKDRWRTFIYFEHQKKLVGRDGEEAFARVFGKEARLVVVLYRPEWGQTPWTRMEETAIRNRAHDEGYDFTVFIPLDKPPSKPAWLPKNRLWANLDRFGVQGAAAAIEARLEEAGAGSRPETIEQKADRLRREEHEDREKLAFLEKDGRILAAREAIAMLDRMSELASRIGATPERIDERCMGCFRKDGFTVCVGWYPGPYSNVTEDGRLNVALWQGGKRLAPGLVYVDKKPRVMRETNYTFDVTRVTHQALWRPERGSEEPLPTAAIADLAINPDFARFWKKRKRRGVAAELRSR